MQSKCNSLEPSMFAQSVLTRRQLFLAACLASFATLGSVQFAVAGESSVQKMSGPQNNHSMPVVRPLNHELLLSENTGYDGASLPPPSKKRSQTAPSVTGQDDTSDDTASRKHHHKKQDADLSAESMSATDPAAGASLPPPKKVSKPAEAAKNNLANDRDSRSSGEKRGGRDAGGMFGKGPLDLTALSLTDEQKQKIAQMHADNGGKMRDLMRKRRDLSVQMRDLMFDPDVSEAQIRSKRDEVRVVQEKLEDLRLNDFLGIRSVLTVEQRQKLKDVKIANRPKDGEAQQPPSAAPKRADGDQKPESKRLADTQSK